MCKCGGLECLKAAIAQLPPADRWVLKSAERAYRALPRRRRNAWAHEEAAWYVHVVACGVWAAFNGRDQAEINALCRGIH
jgi:hypothetical protein